MVAREGCFKQSLSECVTNLCLPSASISPSVLGVTALNSQSGSKGIRHRKQSQSTLLRVKSPLSSQAFIWGWGEAAGNWGARGDSPRASFVSAVASSLHEPQKAACGKTNFLKSG